jgi:tRNA pseudouridine38-40 synthase
MTRVVRLTLAYDGTGFHGWAKQREQRTVEGVLQTALERFLRDRPKISVAGRTDAGVHARGQVVSFRAADVVDVGRLQPGLNALLAPEVVVTEALVVPDGFHARHSATAREYRYRIETGPFPDPFTARFVWHRPGELSLPRMRAGARELVGEHDFASFCRLPRDGSATIRNLQRLVITRSGGLVEVTARANAFLHQMVRSLVGTLVAVGDGRIEPDRVHAILAARDRSAAAQMAPSHGLTLERVVYGRR